jgi:hypothetical protein
MAMQWKFDLVLLGGGTGRLSANAADLDDFLQFMEAPCIGRTAQRLLSQGV